MKKASRRVISLELASLSFEKTFITFALMQSYF